MTTKERRRFTVK